MQLRLINKSTEIVKYVASLIAESKNSFYIFTTSIRETNHKKHLQGL